MGMNNNRDRVFDEMTGVVSGHDNKDMAFRGIILMKPEPEAESAAQKVFRIYEDKTPWVARDIQLLENSVAELQTNWKTLEVQETCTSLNTEESAFAASEISFCSNQPESDAEKITEFFKWHNIIDNPHPEKTETNTQCGFPIGHDDQNEFRIIGGFDGFKQNFNSNNRVTSEKSCHISWNDHVECYGYPLETSTSTMEVRMSPNVIDNRPRIRSQPDFFHDNSTKNTYHQKQTGANTEPFREETKQYRKVCVPSHDSSSTLRKYSERFIKSEKLNFDKETKRTVTDSPMEGSRWHNDVQSRPNVPHGDTNSKPFDFGFDLNKGIRSEVYFHEDSNISCYNDKNNDCNYCDAYDIKKSVSDRKNEKDPKSSQKEYLLAGEEKFTKNCPVQKKDSVDCLTDDRSSHQEQPVVKEANRQNDANKYVLSDKRKRMLRKLLGLDATADTDVLVMLKI